MVWSYSGDPRTDDKDRVRFEIADTDSTDPLVQDEEIMYALSVEAHILGAAARCCESIARKFARDVDYRLGPQYVYTSHRAKLYAELAAELRRRAAMGSGMYVGGIDPQEYLKDRDLRQPAFKRGIMSNYYGEVDKDA